jgi:3-dehydroquinate synthase
VVGHDLAGDLPPLVASASTVVVLCDRAVAGYAAVLADALVSAGHRVETSVVEPGERAKSLDAVAGLWDAFAGMRLTRSDAVVAVGGGASTDSVGFAAATWLRGIRVVQVPTTLLGMVDAAIGGKTAINTAAGKNLVGAFHPPAGVLVDLSVLDSLPAALWRDGMAEVVKAGFIGDPAILDLVERNPSGAGSPHGPDTRELVERSIRVKADVVSGDLRESGPREYLNYGHTLAHAIEQVEHFRIPHGQAVSIGLVFAAALGRQCGYLDDGVADRHRQVLTQLGLPTSYPADRFPDLLDAMSIDKKTRGARRRFVVLKGLGMPTVLEDPQPSLLEAAYEEVAAG